MNAMDEVQRLRKIALLKRVLKDLAQMPRTTALEADMNALERWITELGGDGRTGAHREIRKAKGERDVIDN